MLIAASEATGQSLALLATFIGVGVIVNILIIYILGLVQAEHRQNQERMRDYE